MKRRLSKTWLPVHCLLILCCSGRIQAQTLQPAQNSALLNSRQGAIVELPGFLSDRDIPSLNYQKLVLPGPQFIISDDPEYIRFPEGIALKEAVQPGTVRLYMYNVNGIKEPAKMDRKITAVIKNTSSATMHIRMLRYSSQKPSGNYFLLGKQGLADFFSSGPDEKVRTVDPGMAIPIDEKMEKNIFKYDELAHGIYEFVIDQPGEVNIIQTDTSISFFK